MSQPHVSAFESALAERGFAIDARASALAGALSNAYPALRVHVLTRPEDVLHIVLTNMRIARDLRAYRKIAMSHFREFRSLDEVRRELRRFAQRERLRVAARELISSAGADVDETARELSDLAQVCLEIATNEALAWADARFGVPTVASSGLRCGFAVLGMGKLGGRELNCGSDVDLLLLYETDDGAPVAPGASVGSSDHTLHEYFTRVAQRLTATLDEVTEDGFCWRVDLRLRPEGSRGPLVNSLPAAERYYETWGRTWERAALLRARPVAGNLAFGAAALDALAPFVWRKVVDPRVAVEMAELVERGRVELSAEPARDLKLGPGAIREVEFFVQSLQLIWGGKDPSLRMSNTLDALRRLRLRGLVTDREGRELENAYLVLRRLEHRVQFATGIQTHALPRGDLLETIAKSVGFAAGKDLERDVDKTRRRVSVRFASLTRGLERAGGTDRRFASLLSALETGEEGLVRSALAEPVGGGEVTWTASADLARHLLSLARRPDYPLGSSARDRHPGLATRLVEAIADAADSEQAARLLGVFLNRLHTPSVYVRAMADDPCVIRKLVGLFGASLFLGESLAFHPELADSLWVSKTPPTPERAARQLAAEVANSAGDESHDVALGAEEHFVGALRRAKSRLVMEVGLAELSGELRTREATRVLSAVADATLSHALSFALAQRNLPVEGLAVIAMGKLGGCEVGYGSDLDIFFLYDPQGRDDDADLAERYVRAAQHVLRLVSMPHGDGRGYELDTRLRPSGSQGLLVVSLDGFARYHGISLDGSPRPTPSEAHDWERQALVKARGCAGDDVLCSRFMRLAHAIAYERPAPDAERVHHLRMRMQRELAREGPQRFDIKLGEGGLVDIEFAVQWLQMNFGRDASVRTADTEEAIAALEAGGHIEHAHAAVFRDGFAFLRRLEQALRVVHGTSASLIEDGAPGIAALARKMGFRHTSGDPATRLLETYRAVTRDVRATYLAALGVAPEQ